MPNRIRTFCLALLAVALVPTAAMACPICLSGKVVAPAQRIEAADQVVLAHPDVAPGAYRVAYSIKGDIPVGQVISEVRAVPVAPAASGDLELLVRNKVSEHWTALGRTRLEVASWLRQLIQAAPVGGAPGWAWPGAPLPPSEADDQAWAARLALVAPRLESSDQLAAAIAFGELARAPYAAMRSLKGAVEPSKAAAWVDDPALADRRSAYMLLFGVVGGPAEGETVGAALGRLAAANEETDLAAILAADLELGGPSRLSWIEETYLGTVPRKLTEIEAVLLALGVQGTADAAVPRGDIVHVYRRFVRHHPAMAGFVAPNLAEWQDVSAADDMEAALRSGTINDPGSQFAVLSYLRDARSPRRAASIADPH